jgi:integrase
MSVSKDNRSPYWRFDFQHRGHRFFGSTKATTKREAEAVERAERERAKQLVAQSHAARTSLRLDDVAGRYWTEIGQHSTGSRDIHKRLGYLIEFLGKDRLLTEITGDDVGRLVAWRRGQRNRTGSLIGPFTVNDTTRQLRTLFVRARAWGVRFAHEPVWRKFLLQEPQERVRELVGDERARLEASTRDDYAPFFAFAHVSGLRFSECLLHWTEVNWDARQIRKPGKGGRTITVPITSAIREVLWPLRGHHPEYVFTFVARYTRRYANGNGKTIKGQRYPLTAGGVRDVWSDIRTAAKVTDFRFHDYRHNLATKVLRETGNLKLVQRLLNHSDIATTVRYAHVLDGEVAEALERVTKSPKKSPKSMRKVV